METLSFLVEIDGERFTVAGSDDWAVLNVVVTAVRADPKLRRADDSVDISVSGTCEQTIPGEHHGIRWGERSLSLGSKICVTVIATDQRDPPRKRYRSDSTIQESPYTDEEWREMRFKDYLALRKEFEPDA